MTDDSEHGAIPVDDPVATDPPTVDEVMQRQREEFPEQAATSTLREPRHAPTGPTPGDVSGADQHALADEPADEDDR